MKKALKLLVMISVYSFAFIVAFALGVVSKWIFPGAFAKDPLKVEWNESVGTIIKDLAYGDGKYNKFDLYLPTDNSRDDYGLVVYLHGGGFTGGDKSQDAKQLKYLRRKDLLRRESTIRWRLKRIPLLFCK